MISWLDKEIIRGYESIKAIAVENLQKGDISQSILWVNRAVMVANQLNWIYRDEQLDNLMDDISFQTIKKQNKEYHPITKRVVFYDQYGKSFILALQYIEALTYAGYEILYILSDYVDSKKDTSILDTLRKKNNVVVEVISLDWDYKQRAECIYDLTMQYAPELVFLHVKAFSVFNIVLPSLPKNITKYYIDLQDHAMWIKNNNLDYVIPYRDWGATIDIEKRGFKERQILKLPYYPIVKTECFQGFPKEVVGKLVIFTGGDFYKTIDRDNVYWTLVIRILLENPNVVVLFAGKENTEGQKQALIKLADKMDLSNRLISIGFRTDINEVFSHCDIFLGTSPMSGGLMCQYAAYNSKPILQYYNPTMATNNETEQVLDYNKNLQVSFTDIEDFLCEAKHLINDATYRQKRGEDLHKGLIRKEQFNDLVKNTLNTNISQVAIKRQCINYDAFTSWWFYLEKKGVFGCRCYLLSLLKLKKYRVMPISAIGKILHIL